MVAFFIPLFLALAPVALAAPLNPPRATPTPLTIGYGMQSGSVSPTLNWQASGKLVRGGCPTNVLITDCFAMTLAATGNLQRRDFDTLEGESEEAAAEAAMAPVSSESQHLVERATTTTNTTVSPRQRIELLSWAPAPAGSKWSYSWKSHLGPNVKAGNTFFHIFQLLRRVDDGGAVVTLSLKNGYAIINDVERGCTNCTSVAMSKISGRTIRHYLDVTYGTNGTLSYKIVDVSKPGSVLLQYNATGEMGSQSSVKFGAYRAVYYGMSSVTNYVGDYIAKRLL